jgi:hypothetical protein
MARQILDSFAAQGVAGDLVRLIDHDIKPGVDADMGDGDAWPSVRARMLEADILVLATPTWMGHMSSVACRALETLDAELSETDDDGRPDHRGQGGPGRGRRQRRTRPPDGLWFGTPHGWAPDRGRFSSRAEGVAQSCRSG